MKKFRKWMRGKGFNVDIVECIYYYVSGVHSNQVKVLLPKQMLIGYMIEYLFECEHKKYHKFINYIKADISPEFIYKDLEELVKKSDHPIDLF